MTLNDREIKKLISEGKLITNLEDDAQIQPSTVDLRLSKYISRNRSNGVFWERGTMRPIIEPKLEALSYDSEMKDGYVLIEPGEFLLLATKEIIDLPENIMATVHGKSSVARMGIMVECAGLVDAGFDGTITLEVVNFNSYPVKLYEGMSICQIKFEEINPPLNLYSIENGNKYNGQILPTVSKYHENFSIGGETKCMDRMLKEG